MNSADIRGRVLALKLVRMLALAALVAAGCQVLIAQETRRLGAREFVRDGRTWTQIDPGGHQYQVNADVITVKFKDGVSNASQVALHPALGATELRRAITGFVDIEIASGQDVFAAIDAYMASSLVEIAEPNTIGRYEIVPNDTSYGSEWHLPKIMAPEAWDTNPGAPVAIVAVLDSGTEFTHEDLGPGSDGYRNVWVNTGEDAWRDPTNPSTGNGVDDDMNGYVDDWLGWHFDDGDNDPSGTFYHGTAVAGVISAKTHNAKGIAGVAGGWNGAGTRSMIGAVGNAAPNGAILDDAILYSGMMGAHVVQMSLTVGQSAAIDSAIEMARDTYNMSVICAAGNSGVASVGYPSSNPDVMAIGSTTSTDAKSGFSNYGPDLEIAAPGSSIFMLDLNDGYASASGTSFAAPVVSGVVALMLSVNPSLTEAEIRQILKDTADKVGGYNYNWNPSMPGHSQELGYGRLNAEAALDAVGGMFVFSDGFESENTTPWSVTEN